MSLKNDCTLFGRLYIASQCRGGELDDFFSHENLPWPPSISEDGALRVPNNKATLLNHIIQENQPKPPQHVQCKIFDGAVLVHAIPPLDVATFNEYARKQFLPYVISQLQFCNRIDIVWDKYLPDSLKQNTQNKRGTGIRTKVGDHVRLPNDFSDFLRNSMNKQELFNFLTDMASLNTYPHDKQIYISDGMYTALES